jgi:hypothetical protein
LDAEDPQVRVDRGSVEQNRSTFYRRIAHIYIRIGCYHLRHGNKRLHGRDAKVCPEKPIATYTTHRLLERGCVGRKVKHSRNQWEYHSADGWICVHYKRGKLWPAAVQFNIDAGDDVVVDEENSQARKQGQPVGNTREFVVAQTPTKSAKEKKNVRYRICRIT